MSSTLEQIRAKLKEQQEKRSGNNNNANSDKTLFAHWNIPMDSIATIRFLPDANPDNIFFWRERQMIELSFSGVKGQDEMTPVVVKVPCAEMWNKPCPILTEIRPWFKDPELEDAARKYWVKRSYLYQGFVVDSKLDEETPENPIRRFVLNGQIHKIVEAALMSDDFENLPTHYEHGTDFRLSKTPNGKWAAYTTSAYARRERPLSAEELTAIEEFGLRDLNDFMPKVPSEEGMAVIEEMFRASVDGDLYDPERWGEFYKPYNLQMAPKADSTDDAPVRQEQAAPQAPQQKVVVDENDTTPPFDVDEPEVTKSATTESAPANSAAAILARINAKRANG